MRTLLSEILDLFDSKEKILHGFENARKTVGFRYILLFCFRKGNNATQVVKSCVMFMGMIRQCQRWFAKFRSGDFGVNYEPRSGRPGEADDDEIKAVLESNPPYMTRNDCRVTTHCPINHS